MHSPTLSPAAPPAATRSEWIKLVVATSIGNALEWFDIAIFGFFAMTISKVFYPAGNATASLLLTFGSFGASYLIRPLGAMVLGAYADTHGRKRGLSLTISLMTFGTLIIAVLPGYSSIGIAAPILLFAARLIQGFSAGGEFGASTALLMENAPTRRGFLASFQFATQGVATLLAAFFGWILTSNLSTTQINDWGWRIPFLFGLLIGPIGFYIRRFVDEAPQAERAASEGKASEAAPLAEVFGKQKAIMLTSMGMLIVSTACNYMLTYVPTYAVRQFGMPASSGFAASLISGAILTLATPLFGALSDRIGQLRQMTIAGLLFLFTVYPAFLLLVAHASLPGLMMVVGWLAILKSLYFSALPSLMADIFPIRTRATGLAVSYNVGVTVFGSFAPAIITMMIALTKDKSAPGMYLMIASILSLLALYAVRRMKRY